MNVFKFVVPDLRLMVIVAESEVEAVRLAAEWAAPRGLDVSWLVHAQVTVIPLTSPAVVAFVGGTL